MEEKRSFADRFAEGAAKLGNQIHLKTLRDAFATIMPLTYWPVLRFWSTMSFSPSCSPVQRWSLQPIGAI